MARKGRSWSQLAYSAIATNVSHALRLFREEQGLTQEEAARRIRCSRQTLSLIESGKQSCSVAMFLAQCNLYQVGMNRVIDRALEIGEALRNQRVAEGTGRRCHICGVDEASLARLVAANYCKDGWVRDDLCSACEEEGF